ncbi:hypothetical protein ACB098_11G085600 [Castanea mollissima]
MKRSPASSCSSSSSSSCVGSVIPHQSEKPKAKAKRAKKTHNPEKCQNGNSAGSARRSSIYRGVTRHRWTGRYEAHLWDKSSWNNIQNKKGRQVYLGAYDNEEAAAHTYDLAALKYWGPGTTLNFPIETYTKELEEMQKVTKEEYLASLRRRSSGFSRGVSKYRGVARHHHNGRWEARIGRVFGNKYLYLGTYNTQEEAAAAYDMAAIEYRGANAVTNFDISNYIDRMKKKIPGFNAQSSTQSDAALPNNCQPQSKVEVDNCQPQSKVEVAVEQLQQQKQEKQEVGLEEQLQYNISTQLPPCMDTTSTMVGMEPSREQEEDPWSFLDNVPDLPIEKPCELNDLFDHTGFEDDIDFIFEAAAAAAVTHQDVVDVKMDGILDDISGFDDTLKVVGVSRSLDNIIGQERLLSSSSSSSSSSSAISSPSSSTTTSVSCIYSA